MIKTMSALCLGVVVSTSAQSFAQVVDVRTAPEVVGINGEDLYRARIVLRRFFNRERRPECYRILFATVDGNLRVDFSPKQPEFVIDEEGSPPIAPAPHCPARHVGYVLDRQGNVLRRFYSR